jgi:N-acetylmuramoyl-L-alanine amidase
LTNELPLRAGATGDAVRDVQRRLAGVGLGAGGDTLGTYGPGTEEAVRRFQERRGLRVDGVCGAQTWDSLVEADRQLGDRLLYERRPMVRGDDVAELQQLLGELGFDAGRVDGIFGPNTTEALIHFQRNAGLITDGICGPDSLRALHRVAREDTGPTVSSVREIERLRESPRQLEGRLMAVGETGGLSALVTALGRALVDEGAVVTVLHHPDESVQASEANAFGAEAFIGLAAREQPGVTAAYYAAGSFVSHGGQRLALLIVEEAGTLGPTQAARGMRLPVLRETRMPAVVIECGPPEGLVEHLPELVETVRRALRRWVTVPVDP